MIATDMDQTFLDNQNQYNKQRFKEIFLEMNLQNIHFVVASGSQHERLQSLFKPIAEQMDFISQNGSIIYSGNELLDVQQLSSELIQETLDSIISTFNPNEILINICGLASSYVDTATSSEIIDFLSQFYKHLQTVDNIGSFTTNQIDDPIVKIAVGFGDVPDVNHKIAQLRSMLNPRLSSLSSGFNTELVGLNHVDKASALKHLMENMTSNPRNLSRLEIMKMIFKY